MVRYFFRRFLISIPLLIGVSFLTFMMIQLVPGDPVIMMLGETSSASPEQIESLREELGFNDPLHIQYMNYLNKLIKGDFGTSMRSKRPVLDEIKVRLKSTFELTIAGVGFAVFMGISLGIVAALNHNKIIDNVASVFALLGVSIPSFWLGLVLIYIFAVQLRWLPVTSTPNSGIKGLILPALTLGLWAQGSITRLTRSGMLEVMMNDYIRTARSKGLSEQTVILRHGLRNALIPVVTVIGLMFGGVLAGTTVIETVFARTGLGLLLVQSIISKDFYLVMGIILFVASSYIFINMLVDYIYVWIDPRIRSI